MAILLRGGTLLPMSDGAGQISGDILVSGARIAQIGTDLQLPPDTEVVDCSG